MEKGDASIGVLRVLQVKLKKFSTLKCEQDGKREKGRRAKKNSQIRNRFFTHQHRARFRAASRHVVVVVGAALRRLITDGWETCSIYLDTDTMRVVCWVARRTNCSYET